MTRRSSLILLMIAAVTVPCAYGQRSARSGQPERDASNDEFNAFRLVLDRNIFDSTRQRVRERPRTEERASTRPVSTTEYFVLNGVLLYELSDRTEMIAFFSGSRSEYNTTLKAGDGLAGHKIAEVRTDGVALHGGEEKFELPVGFALSRRDQGKWQVGSGSEFVSSRAPEPSSTREESSSSRREESGGTSTSSRTPPSTPSTPGAADDVLKKLMERRRQEAGR